jgi:hypothetical protein
MVDQRRVALLDLGDVFVGVFGDLTEALVALVDEDMDSDQPSVLADGFGLEALGLPRVRLTGDGPTWSPFRERT